MKTWINVFVTLSLLLSSVGFHRTERTYAPVSRQSSAGQETTPTITPEATPTPTPTFDFGAYPAPNTPTPEPTDAPIRPSETPTPQPTTVTPIIEPTQVPTEEASEQKEPLLWNTEVNCGPQGQSVRLTWQMSTAAVDGLTPEDTFRLYIPRGLIPLFLTVGIYESEAGVLTIPASPKGEMTFVLASEMVDWADLKAEWLIGDQLKNSVSLKVIPGGYGQVNVEGGKISAPAYGVQVEVPEKVFSQQTSICIGRVNEIDPHNSLSGNTFQINAYNLENGEAVRKFDSQVTIQVSYNEENYGSKESQLALFYFNEEYQDWVALNSYVDKETNTLIGYTDHFTPFDYKAESWESARLPTVDSFAVAQFTGAAAYSFPFQLPAGLGGWQPSLALSYNSQTVDSANSLTQASWVGMGWSLDTGYIQRNMGDMVNYYGDYVGGAINDDSDTGHDLDDTFSLVLNGQSWRLLRIPDQDQNSETIDYRTEDESFMRIRRYRSQGTRVEGNKTYPVDNSYWVVWDKNGNTYNFNGTARYPVGCHGPILVTWKWSLTQATNPFEQSIDYTYATETVQRVAVIYGPESGCDAPITDMAVYPDTITYPNGNYRVVFNREEREDHKAAWVTEPDSLYQSIRTQIMSGNWCANMI
jgi:hypothetical protein